MALMVDLLRNRQQQPGLWYPQNNGTKSIWMWGLKPVSLLENKANVGFHAYERKRKELKFNVF